MMKLLEHVFASWKRPLVIVEKRMKKKQVLCMMLFQLSVDLSDLVYVASKTHLYSFYPFNGFVF